MPYPGGMASKKTPKKTSAFKQLWQVFQITRQDDRSLPWELLGILFGGIVLGAVVGVLLRSQWFMLIMWIVVGLLAGALGALNLLNRRAERNAFRRMAGQPGAAGAVLSALRGSWQSSQMPVSVNPRTGAALYRAVGPKGIVLVLEGEKTKSSRILREERAKVRRVVPNVTINVLRCAEDGDGVPISRLLRSVRRVHSDAPRLSKSEVRAVQNRLSTLDNPVAMPKGIDPLRMHPDHRAIRGR